MEDMFAAMPPLEATKILFSNGITTVFALKVQPLRTIHFCLSCLAGPWNVIRMGRLPALGSLPSYSGICWPGWTVSSLEYKRHKVFNLCCPNIEACD